MKKSQALLLLGSFSNFRVSNLFLNCFYTAYWFRHFFNSNKIGRCCFFVFNNFFFRFNQAIVYTCITSFLSL